MIFVNAIFIFLIDLGGEEFHHEDSGDEAPMEEGTDLARKAQDKMLASTQPNMVILASLPLSNTDDRFVFSIDLPFRRSLV